MNNFSTISLDSKSESKLDSTMILSEKEEAIPLITYDSETKKFEINESAEHILKKLEAPLGVVSVAGMYRTGKSYLLNRMLLNRGSGFSVGPSINPCTKGLWIWSRPLSGYSPDGSPLNVLVIDTEGIGATDEDQNHDTKIFTLGILLSSYFIFNSSGSIDENAINNLSFIVNITRSIQLSTKKEEIDLKEIAKYLPSFMWVIRDFSLKLIDTEGEPLTSKEYLEKSLELQKGYTDTIESKNKIRTLIKEFFRDRDCVTLVRPLTEEDSLQNLSKMEPNKLRPEFLDQVAQLRKKVLHKVKPKTMNNKNLNGEMFVNVMKSYVNAINSGAVPVIENAWSFMCKNECSRAMNNALMNYIDYMNDNVKRNLPIDDMELQSQHKESKKNAIKLYSSTAIGNYFEDHLTELKNNIKEKFLHYSIENERETKRACENFVNNNYSDIKRNISMQSYQNFAYYKSDIEAFIAFYLQKAPNGPGRNLILYEFIIKEVLMHCETQINQSLSDVESMSSKNKEDILKMNNLINDLKAEYSRESVKNNDIIKKLENERNDLISLDKSTRDTFSNTVKEKDGLIKELSEKIDCQKRDYERKLIEIKSKMEMNDESTQECERSYQMKEAEFEKSKLLLEQKIKFLEKNLEDMSNKDKEHFNELKNIRKECMSSNKELIEKYEAQIKLLNKKYEQIQERDIDLEKSLLEKEKRLENEKIKAEEQINELQKKIAELNGVIKFNESEMKSIENLTTHEKEKIKSESESKMFELKADLENLTSKLKESEEKFSALKNKSIKEISVLKQTLEFQELQLKDLKSQGLEEKKSHDALIKVYEEKHQSMIIAQEDYLNQINNLKMNHLNECEQLKVEIEEKETFYKTKIDSLSAQCTELEQKMLKEKNTFEEERSIQSSKIEEITAELEILKPQIAKLENEKETLAAQYKLALENLNISTNQKIEEILRQCRTELEEANERNEKTIKDLKQHYEVEKMSLDSKLEEEKEKMNRQIQEVENYYLDRMKELERMRDEKVAELEENVENLEINHNNYVIHTEQEIAVKNQQIESLTRFLSDSKENLQSIQQAHGSMMQNQFDRFKEEKAEINFQIDKLVTEIKEKERQNGSLSSKAEQLSSLADNLKSQLDSLSAEAKKESEELNEKISQLQNKIKSQKEEIAVLKSNYSKDIALKNQEIEFYSTKISELTKTIEESAFKNEEKIKIIKDSLELEYNEKISNLNKDKLDLENKLIQKKKEVKDLETTLRKEIAMLEKEKAVLNEKLVSVNLLKDEMVETLEKEREMVEAKIQLARSEGRRENELTLKENEMMRSKLKKLENDYNEVSANYEKDNDLWKTKFDFLEEQRNQARMELTEYQKKFEMQLDNLAKKGVLEKDKLETMQNAVVISLEQRYKSHIKELQDNFNNKLEEVNSKRQLLESENKLLNDKLKEKMLSNNSSINELEKKILLLSENETKLRSDFSLRTEEKDKKIKELSEFIETDRTNYKEKVIELESRLREYETKRNTLTVDNIKEKALNDKDKQNMQNEIQSLNARIASVERINLKLVNENKDLVRENEKLKKGGSKTTSANSSNIFIPKYSHRYNTANKENNRNHSNTSFDMKPYDKLDFLSMNKNSKYSSDKNSQKSEEDNLSATNIII